MRMYLVLRVIVVILYFFFSSRRRHTRFDCDWSSDVCSSDLAATSVAAFIECPLNWRVKLNSPSLCPTMFSVMYTGINFFPLCTAMVCPTISGMIVERRDQVRKTFFSLREFMPSIRVARYPSINGPFLVERAINQLLAVSS